MTNETSDALSESVRDLVGMYSELTRSEHGGINGGEEYVFVTENHDGDVEPPAILPNITHASSVYFMIPADVDLPNYWSKPVSPQLADDVARGGNATDSEGEYWPVDAEIIESIEKYHFAVCDAADIREAKELLVRERRFDSGLYASAAVIDQETPMLIEGLMRERGVSVIYGAFDEFKTTLVLDMMAHVAMGAPWQGRKVKPRPVIWYALEGKEEIPVRLQALEASLNRKDTAWGDDCAPTTVLDRIPVNYRDWRAEISRIMNRWQSIHRARSHLKEMPIATEQNERTKESYEYVRYPSDFSGSEAPVIVIDTLSLALGGEDEKGPRAVSFINDCLDLLKERPDFEPPEREMRVILEDGEQTVITEETDATRAWKEQYPNDTEWMSLAVAAHIIVVHHQTKTGIGFAGHGAIAANTHGLYRVHRFGNITDTERPFAGQITPIRVKGIPRPAPIRFDVDVVPVEGTKQTAAILKDKATAIPKEIRPIIDAFRELENPEEITPTDLNACIDVVAASGAKDGSAKRKARQRVREKLEAAGVIEAVEDENGNATFYRFHDTAAV